MAKFSVVYVKQHPVMFGAIFLVFGLFLWLLLNKGAAGASSNSTTVNPSPVDPNVLAAQVQLQGQQIEGQTQVALGQLSLAANQQNNQTQEDLAALALQAQTEQIQADHDNANAQIEASVQALTLQLSNDLAVTHDNNQFMIDYAKNAQDAANMSLEINAGLQEQLSADQSKAFTIATLANVIPTLSHKRGEQNQAFDILARVSSGDNTIPIAPTHSGGIPGLGSFLLGALPLAVGLA